MPTTRSQSQMASQRKTRASNKRVRAVVKNDPVSFDFGVHDDQAQHENADVKRVEQVKNKANRESSASEIASSARTRPFCLSTEKNEKVDNAQVSDCDSMENKGKINAVQHMTSHTGNLAPSSPAKAEVVQDESSSVISEVTVTTSTGNPMDIDGLSGQNARNDEKVATTSSKPKESNVGVVKKVPRYVLEPDAFQENPAERERILKSIYDRKRREKEMKEKVGKLKQENIQLKKMLMFAMASKTPAKGGVFVSLKPVTTIAARASTSYIVNAGRKEHIIAPSMKTKMSLPLRSPSAIPGEQHITSGQRQAMQHKHGQKRRKENGPGPLKEMLAKEKESINKLYKQLDSDEDEDMEFVWAAPQGPTPSDCVEAQLGNDPGPVLSAEVAEKSKRKQTRTCRNVQNAGNNAEDEIQILKEVKKPAKVAKQTFYPLKEMYADVIFEEI